MEGTSKCMITSGKNYSELVQCLKYMNVEQYGSMITSFVVLWSVFYDSHIAYYDY